jgi:5'-nucleotidase (lipoprotein e(P4) family)
MRNSAEYRAATLQAYRSAALALDRRIAGKPSGAWAVILDADETVLDNSQYSKERFAIGERFSPATWHEWTKRRAAGTIPGAAGFLRHVQQKGGRIAIVTNRAASECADTEAVFRSSGLPFDVMLCNPNLNDSSKQARFDQVANGTTPAGLPPLEVVMWVGDNIQDFPGLSQQSREKADQLADFGDRFIVLPNPSYGSWERSPRQ